MTPRPKSASPPDPLKAFTLDALLEGAAQIRPDGLALVDTVGGSLTFAALAQQAACFAGALIASGLQPGETMMLLGGNEIATLVALAGGVRAGINTVLAPPEAPPGFLAEAAAQTRTALLVCGPALGGIELVDKGFATAALAEGVRMVGALHGANADAVDFSAGALAGETAPGAPPAHTARIITLSRHGDACTPAVHQQRALVVAALDLIARAQFSASQPLISTLAPHSLAGLVAGPLAALLCGARLHLHGMFNGNQLRAQIAANPGAQLIVPVELAGPLSQAGLLQAGALAGIVARSRWQEQGGDFSPPVQMPAGIGFVDLHSFGERALVAERRGPDGRARALLDPPHEIEIGGTILLAVEAETSSNGLRFFGAGVSELEE